MVSNMLLATEDNCSDERNEIMSRRMINTFHKIIHTKPEGSTSDSEVCVCVCVCGGGGGGGIVIAHTVYSVQS